MIQDWKDFYRMLFVVACRIWDEDACKSWRNKFVLDLECITSIGEDVWFSIPVVQSCVRYFWCIQMV